MVTNCKKNNNQKQSKRGFFLKRSKTFKTVTKVSQNSQNVLKTVKITNKMGQMVKVSLKFFVINGQKQSKTLKEKKL